MHVSILIGTIVYWAGWLLRLLALFLIPRNRKPTAGMAWLIAIFLFPIPGWILFLIIGGTKLPRSRRNLQKTLDHSIESSMKSLRREYPDISTVIDASVPAKYNSVATLAKALGHLPVFSNNTIQGFDDYQQSIGEIVEDIKRAHQSVSIEYFAITYDTATQPLFDSLRDAVQRGVTVRVLYDYLGSHSYPGRRQMKRKFKEYNIPAYPMLPVKLPGAGFVRPDLRNHRKLVVIDHAIGYTGSQNLIDRSYHRKDTIVYDEFVVRVTGPIVSQLAIVFSTDWYTEVGVPINNPIPNLHNDIVHDPTKSLAQLIPSGPGYEDDNNLRVFIHAIYIAQLSITIVNPYFVPTDELMTAITSAARRGVHVKMINSAVIDQWLVGHAQRSYYQKLLESGVELYLYKRPTLLHSKFIIIDNDLTFVGSSNLDVRSFELDYELTLIAYDLSFAGKMGAIAQKYQEKSRQVTLKGWMQRKPIRQAFDTIARLTSSLQ